MSKKIRVQPEWKSRCVTSGNEFSGNGSLGSPEAVGNVEVGLGVILVPADLVSVVEFFP